MEIPERKNKEDRGEEIIRRLTGKKFPELMTGTRLQTQGKKIYSFSKWLLRPCCVSDIESLWSLHSCGVRRWSGEWDDIYYVDKHNKPAGQRGKSPSRVESL